MVVDSVPLGARIAHGSVLGSLSCLMQHHGFDSPLRRFFFFFFFCKGDFSLGVNMDSDSFW